MINKRYELWILLFTGCIVHMDSNLNLSMAIVAMTKPNSIKNVHHIVSECRVINNNVSVDTNVTSSVDQYDWSTADKNMILGSRFWLSGVATFTGGILCQKYGGKIVFGYSNFIGGLLNFLIPMAADFGVRWLVAVRVLQGFLESAGPGNAIGYFLARWVPQNERSKFSSAMSGLFFGSAFSYIFNGFIMHLMNWRYVFHITGILTTLWSLIWYFIIYDNPEEHPRISRSELNLINESIGDKLSKKSLPIPWTRILTSVPVMVNTMCDCTHRWISITLLTFTPTYLATIHGFPYHKLGTYSSLPHLLKTFVAIGFAIVTDAIIKRKILTVTNSRKFTVIIEFIIGGFIFGSLTLVGCDVTLALITLTVASLVYGAHVSLCFPNLVELSPNFSAAIHGMQGLINASVAMFAPIVVAYFTNHHNGIAGWNRVFIILMLLSEVSGLLYLMFGSSKLQSWNTERTKDLESNRKLHETGDEEKKLALTNESIKIDD